MQMGINQTRGVEMGRKHGAVLVRSALAGTPFSSAAADSSKKKSDGWYGRLLAREHPDCLRPDKKKRTDGRYFRPPLHLPA